MSLTLIIEESVTDALIRGNTKLYNLISESIDKNYLEIKKILNPYILENLSIFESVGVATGDELPRSGFKHAIKAGWEKFKSGIKNLRNFVGASLISRGQKRKANWYNKLYNKPVTIKSKAGNINTTRKEYWKHVYKVKPSDRVSPESIKSSREGVKEYIKSRKSISPSFNLSRIQTGLGKFIKG